MGARRKTSERRVKLPTLTPRDLPSAFVLKPHDPPALYLQAILNAGVQTVVCWRTDVEDGAARIFARSFFEEIAKDKSPKDAFNQAKLAVTSITRSGKVAGAGSDALDVSTWVKFAVPKYELRCPTTASPSTQMKPKPWAAGVPVFFAWRHDDDGTERFESDM